MRSSPRLPPKSSERSARLMSDPFAALDAVPRPCRYTNARALLSPLQRAELTQRARIAVLACDTLDDAYNALNTLLDALDTEQ
jgi:hypothetical protein